jgi:transcription elongation factor Elf1
MAPTPSQRSSDTAAVKRWTRQILGTVQSVLVTELRCAKPQCNDAETVIAILDTGKQRRFTFHCPLAQLTYDVVHAALTQDVSQIVPSAHEGKSA